MPVKRRVHLIVAKGSGSQPSGCCREQFAINRKRAQRLMRLMGLEGVHRKRSTSRQAPGHKVHPYLLRDIAFARPDQAWASDVTFIRCSMNCSS